MSAQKKFDDFSQKVAYASGHPMTFFLAAAVVAVWAISGPFFGFSETWQLIINTGTTIITFLMVFLIQSTQNRDTVAMQLKLDELIRATEGAHKILLDIEELGENDLTHIREEYERLARSARAAVKQGNTDTSPAAIDLSPILRRERELP